ncbi:MAG: alpha/beta hydrolase [Silvibacterium sp.]|nr:alpha/beta hydrolase [Silvibacterium sp.]
MGRISLLQPFFLVCLAALAFCCSLSGSSLPATDTDPSPLLPGEHYATLGDVQLHYTVAGDGPLLIVFSPGWGPGSLYLQRGLAPLEQHYKVLFIDTRGSGKSSRPSNEAKMSGADMADDIEQLRMHLGLQKIRLLGHSDSGAIAIDYAERYPAEVSDLILVDSSKLGKSEADKAEREQSSQLINSLKSDPRYKAAFAAWDRPWPPTTDESMMQFLKDTFPFYFADLDNVPTFAKTLEGTTPSSYALRTHNNADSTFPWRQQERLGEVRARTLVIVGKQDRICPTLIAEHIHEGIPGSTLVEVDDSAHFPWIEQPVKFFDAVNQFLKASTVIQSQKPLP